MKVGIAVNSGHMEGYKDDANREEAYTIKWLSGVARAADQQHYDLSLEGVSGTLIKKGKPAAEFSADAGTAVKMTGVLSLTGNVRVTSLKSGSKSKGSSVSCDSAVYETSNEIVKTSGHVILRGISFTFGPFSELWCTNDLSEVASPDQFMPVRHNQHKLKLP